MKTRTRAIQIETHFVHKRHQPEPMRIRADVIVCGVVRLSTRRREAVGLAESAGSLGASAGRAGDGQVVQVRTAGGQQISGIAKAGGTVEVAF